MKAILFLLPLVALLQADAQTKPIVKAQAFYMISLPGNIPVDEAGQPTAITPRVNRFILVETKGTARPVFSSVFYNGDVYTIRATEVKSGVQAGVLHSNGNPVRVTVSKGNRLWKAELTLKKKQSTVRLDAPFNKIIINGKQSGKGFSYRLNREIRLQAPLYP